MSLTLHSAGFVCDLLFILTRIQNSASVYTGGPETSPIHLQVWLIASLMLPWNSWVSSPTHTQPLLLP